MSRRTIDIKVGYSNSSEKEATSGLQAQQRKDTNYIEFVGLTRVRSGTSVNDNDEKIEKIVNDIVSMDAAYDPHQLPDLSVGTKKLFGNTSAPVKKAEKYDNFHTIDWLKDLAKDRFRHRWIEKEKQKGIFEKFQALHDAYSGWFCVLLVGIGAGIVAGIVDIGSQWMVNLKQGVCLEAFWLNRDQCCWGSKNITYDSYQNVMCPEWRYWAEFIGIENESTIYFASLLFHIAYSLIFAFSAAILVKFFAPYACGSGVPEIKTILSGFVIRGYLGKWTLLIKSLGMMLGTSAGLTLGKEGPFVHVASCCGNIFSYLFPKYGRNEAKKREILSAAAAAGVAVAFGAPIGGVLFSLEEVSYYFPLKTLWRSFFCAMVAAFILRTVNPYGKGHDVLFFIDYKPEWFLFELLPFIFLGVLGGLFGFYFIKMNIFWCRIRKTTRLGKYPILEVLLITFITSLIGFFNPYTRMSMSELVKRLVGKCGPADDSLICDYTKNITNAKDDVIPLEIGAGVYESLWKLFLAMIFYLVMLVLTFGIKVPCGLFVPSLTIGAIAGRMVGICMEILSFQYPDFFVFSNECKQSPECVIPGVYALVGACAFLGGATRMTVSLVVIMVELTTGLSIIVPLMVAAFTAKLFGEFLCPGSIYDAHINLNGYPFLDNKEDYRYSSEAIDVMKPQKKDPPLIVFSQEGMTVKEIETIMKETSFSGYPIVLSIESQYLLGYILKRDLQMALEQYRDSGLISDSTNVQFVRPIIKKSDGSIKLHKLVDFAPVCVTFQTPMEVVIDLFRKMGVSIVLVTNYGRLMGTITKKDILKHLNEEHNKEKETKRKQTLTEERSNIL